MRKTNCPPGKVLRHPSPLRLLHWFHVAVTLILALTGFYLSRPWLPPGVLRVAYVRLTHLTSAPLLAATVVLYPFYSMLSGAWHDLVPNRQDWRTAGRLLRYELLLSEEAPLRGKYHLLQKLLYLSFQPVLLLQVATGWALAAPTAQSGSLVVRLAGDLQRVRLVHYFGALYLVLAATFHFYLVLSTPGALVGMVTGWAEAVPPTDTVAEKATRPPHLR
ncbi:MAG: cytochrome b/b6 domain-containing protein [Betaproteobacteria bacterium]